MMAIIHTLILFAVCNCFLTVIGFLSGGVNVAIIIFGSTSLLELFTCLYATNIILRLYKAYPANIKILPEIFEIIKKTSIIAKIPFPQLYLIDSSHANSFVVGTAKKKSSIVLTTAMIDNLSIEELEAVIAYHINQIDTRDCIINTISVVMASYVYAILDIAKLFDSSTEPQRIKKIYKFLSYILFPICSSITILFFMPKKYYLWDRQASTKYNMSMAFVSVLDKLSKLNPKYIEEQYQFYPAIASIFLICPIPYSYYFNNHPTIENRIYSIYNFSKQ